MLTALLAVLFTNLTHLTGLSSEEAIFLQIGAANVSLQGLLLAGMVIGALGVLDDVTISQASTVMALHRANPGLAFRRLSGVALDVGRDHVSATVNTLVLAYVGASLPIPVALQRGRSRRGQRPQPRGGREGGRRDARGVDRADRRRADHDGPLGAPGPQRRARADRG